MGYDIFLPYLVIFKSLACSPRRKYQNRESSRSDGLRIITKYFDLFDPLRAPHCTCEPSTSSPNTRSGTGSWDLQCEPPPPSTPQSWQRRCVYVWHTPRITEHCRNKYASGFRPFGMQSVNDSSCVGSALQFFNAVPPVFGRCTKRSPSLCAGTAPCCVTPSTAVVIGDKCSHTLSPIVLPRSIGGLLPGSVTEGGGVARPRKLQV